MGQQNKQGEEQEFQQQVQQLEAIVKQRMTKEVMQRYGNVKAANPQKALQLIAILGQFIQSGSNAGRGHEFPPGKNRQRKISGYYRRRHQKGAGLHEFDHVAG